MNLIILEPQDFITENRVSLRDRRLQHLMTYHQPEVGQSFKVGILDGLMGRGTVTEVSNSQVVMEIDCREAPPPQLPLTLLLAVPRPKMLKRILQTAATLGIEEIILLNAYKVEKSFWQTPILQPDNLKEQFILGLEQGVATQLPRVRFEKRFKPFVEDDLPALAADKRAFVAHPYQAEPCKHAENSHTLLAIGPEGGFIPYEIEKLQQAGLVPMHMGQRILRVETAIPTACAMLFDYAF